MSFGRNGSRGPPALKTYKLPRMASVKDSWCKLTGIGQTLLVALMHQYALTGNWMQLTPTPFQTQQTRENDGHEKGHALRAACPESWMCLKSWVRLENAQPHTCVWQRHSNRGRGWPCNHWQIRHQWVVASITPALLWRKGKYGWWCKLLEALSTSTAMIPRAAATQCSHNSVHSQHWWEHVGCWC